jgi:hypothetical protein
MLTRAMIVDRVTRDVEIVSGLALPMMTWPA